MKLGQLTTKKINSEDLRLVERVLSGEDKALWEFYKKFERTLFSYIKGKIENTKDGEEILQDILLASLEALRDFTGRSSLKTFVFAICHNKVIDYYRKKKIKQVFFSAMPELGELLTTTKGPEDKLDEKLLNEKIEKTLFNLQPEYKRVLILKYLQGLSIIEMAKNLSQTVKMVESRLFRARKAFVRIYGDI